MKNAILIVTLLLASNICNSQSTKLPNPAAYFTAIIVNNIDTSISWYSEILGFEVIDETEVANRGLKQANLKRGNIHIELIQISTSVSSTTLLEERPQGTRVQGFFKFGIMVNDFDLWMDHLNNVDANIHGSVVTDPTSNKKMVIIKDPDGNRIQLFEE